MQEWQQAKQAHAVGAYKRYLAHYADGYFAAEAQARLAACQPVADVSWVPHTFRLTLVVPRGPQVAASAASAARLAIQAGVDRAAAEQCRSTAVSELYHLIEGQAPVLPEAGWQCAAEGGGGWRCRYDGPVDGPQEKRQTLARKVCPAG